MVPLNSVLAICQSYHTVSSLSWNKMQAFISVDTGAVLKMSGFYLFVSVYTLINIPLFLKFIFRVFLKWINSTFLTDMLTWRPPPLPCFTYSLQYEQAILGVILLIYYTLKYLWQHMTYCSVLNDPFNGDCGRTQRKELLKLFYFQAWHNAAPIPPPPPGLRVSNITLFGVLPTGTISS